jgi:hypothetical protein
MAVVSGLSDVQAAFRDAERQLRLAFRGELRHIAEPVARDTEQLAPSSMSGISRSPRWGKMRIGVTRNLVYVAPREKGLRGRGNVSNARRRANTRFADLLMGRAMEPALERNTPGIERHFDQLLDRVADGFNRGGH